MIYSLSIECDFFPGYLGAAASLTDCDVQHGQDVADAVLADAPALGQGAEVVGVAQTPCK